MGNYTFGTGQFSRKKCSICNVEFEQSNISPFAKIERSDDLANRLVICFECSTFNNNWEIIEDCSREFEWEDDVDYVKKVRQKLKRRN